MQEKIEYLKNFVNNLDNMVKLVPEFNMTQTLNNLVESVKSFDHSLGYLVNKIRLYNLFNPNNTDNNIDFDSVDNYLESRINGLSKFKHFEKEDSNIRVYEHKGVFFSVEVGAATEEDFHHTDLDVNSIKFVKRATVEVKTNVYYDEDKKLPVIDSEIYSLDVESTY